ncbi:hypothetical protein ACIBEJ_00375 [Nonomuraea sp. NPDC050790]|uniref:hypothetical protein n=1 Tax=Nonomuraea sp. NPDC050790 TaxID=3364371 RepID=UPI0037B2EE8A
MEVELLLTAVDSAGRCWKLDGGRWREWYPVADILGAEGAPTMPVAPLQPVLEGGEVTAWETCDLAGHAMRFDIGGSAAGAVTLVTASDRLTDRGLDGEGLAGSRLAAQLLNARQLGDLDALSSMLARAGLDVTGQQGGNRLVAAVERARQALDDLRMVLEHDLDDCTPQPDARLPYEIRHLDDPADAHLIPWSGVLAVFGTVPATATSIEHPGERLPSLRSLPTDLVDRRDPSRPATHAVGEVQWVWVEDDRLMGIGYLNGSLDGADPSMLDQPVHVETSLRDIDWAVPTERGADLRPGWVKHGRLRPGWMVTQVSLTSTPTWTDARICRVSHEKYAALLKRLLDAASATPDVT